ncbi:MAG: hypothetical protein ACM3ZV_03875 [Bacillota bacterium]
MNTGHGDVLPFTNHREAALALLNNCPGLSHMEAGFLGHVCVTKSLTGKQHEWLQKLLRQNGLPALAEQQDANAD